MKTILDKTTELQEAHLVGNQQYKIGRLGLVRGKKFILLPGKQMVQYFNDGTRTVPVFKYRAAFLDSDNNVTHIDGVNLSDLLRSTYGKCLKDEKGEWLPYPEIGFEVKNNKRIPASFGEELNCGWTIRKEYVGTDDKGNSLYDGVIDKPQMFEVTDMELHWTSVFDTIGWCTSADEKGNVEMKKQLIPIIERRMEVPEKALKQLDIEA